MPVWDDHRERDTSLLDHALAALLQAIGLPVVGWREIDPVGWLILVIWVGLIALALIGLILLVLLLIGAT